MSYRVLMVCTGNICRSVMAEEILREVAAQRGLDVVVDSAGISDEEHDTGSTLVRRERCERAGIASPRTEPAKSRWGSFSVGI